MPWTLPLGDVAGVFMSPCASIQIRPSGLPRRPPGPLGRGRDRTGREAVVAAEHERKSAALERRERHLVDLLTDPRDVQDVFLPIVVLVLRLGNRRRQVAVVDDRVAQPREALAEAGDTKRRRPHVHAPSSAAEIERHANDVNGLHELTAWNCRT